MAGRGAGLMLAGIEGEVRATLGATPRAGATGCGLRTCETIGRSPLAVPVMLSVVVIKFPLGKCQISTPNSAAKASRR